MKSFEEFLNKVGDQDKQQRFLEVFAFLEKEFPQLEKRIAWNQPMFTDHGTFVGGFSAYSKHMAFAPEEYTVARFSDRIKQAGLSHTKMLVRFPWDQPVDYDLLREMIAFNIQDKKDVKTFWRMPEGKQG